MNRYIRQDHLATDLARMYSNETGEPFFVAVGDFPEWDLQSTSGEIRIEAKSESSTIRTNNVAIEYWNTDFNRPSGVLATKANVWLHIVLTGEGWLAIECDVDVLRRLCIETGVVKSNGTNSLCKIIPLDVFKRSAKRVFPFESDFLIPATNSQEDNLGRGGIPNQPTPRVGT